MEWMNELIASFRRTAQCAVITFTTGLSILHLNSVIRMDAGMWTAVLTL